MTNPYRTVFAGLLFFLFFIQTAVFGAGIDVVDGDFSYWYGFIDADEETIVSAFGQTAVEIAPEALGSRAERIIWYEKGPTFWFEAGRVVQIRLDSAVSGSIEGICIGSTVEDVITVGGRPWIEDGGSLYYNLPWRSGPVRLRFVFDGGGLSEAYLYIVR